MCELGTSGLLKIGNEADRVTVASILFKNKYSVAPVRKKMNGKSYEYYVQYQLNSPDIVENPEEMQNEG